MNAKKFSDAMSELDTKYVDEALNYKKKAKRPGWIKWGAMAACLCLMVVVAIPIVNHFNNGATDIEPLVEYSLEEAPSAPDFGELFPTQILEGYALDGSVSVYDEAVLVARFINEALDDTMTIRIANKDWFTDQTPNIDLGVVQYTEKANGKTTSVIFLDGGEHIVQYSFSNTDIADNDGFCDMVNSAAYFTDVDRKVVEFHGKLFNKGDLSKETIEWLEWYNSLSPEDQLAISSIPADLYTYDSSGAVDEVADGKVVEFHGKLFSKDDLSIETIEWLEWYNSLSPEDQLAISSVPADLYTYDSSGAVDEVADE